MRMKFHSGALLAALLPLTVALIACDTAATADNEVATVAEKKEKRKKDNKGAKTKKKVTTNSETKKVAKRDLLCLVC